MNSEDLNTRLLVHDEYIMPPGKLIFLVYLPL